LFPSTERTKAPPPAAACAGTSELIAGAGKEAGAVMVKGRELELVAALDTETVAVPREAVSAYVMAALSCVPLRNVVGRGEPFQFTTESLVNVVPVAAVTVRVKPDGLQYGVEAIGVVEVEAESDAMARGEIVKETALDVPPPGAGVNTVTGTGAEEADATSAARMVVLSCDGPR
jgi:hypothetical protein